MAKKLNEEQVRSELTGQSAFFQKSPPPLSASTSKTPKPTEKRVERDVEPNARTDKPNGRTERMDQSTDGGDIFSDVVHGKTQPQKRPVKRYSFEVYVDQIESIEDVQYRYKKKTGKRLSSSRFIREAIDRYLNEAQDI